MKKQRIKSITKFTLIAAIFTCLPANIEAQEPGTRCKRTSNKSSRRIDLQRAAMSLLERAPNLKPLPEDALSAEEFMALARDVFGNKKDLDSVDEAIMELEKLIAGVGRPEATINSTPTGWTVRYRGYTDHRKNRGSWETVKTNASPKPTVDPMQYVFQCTKDNGEPCGEQIKTCDTSKNCVVYFP